MQTPSYRQTSRQRQNRIQTSNGHIADSLADFSWPSPCAIKRNFFLQTWLSVITQSSIIQASMDPMILPVSTANVSFYFILGLHKKKLQRKIQQPLTLHNHIDHCFFCLPQTIYNDFSRFQPTPHSARLRLVKLLHGWPAVRRAHGLLLDPLAVPGGVGTTSMCSQSALESHHSFRLS